MSSIEIGKDFIEHFGVRGMRWGVRRSSGGVEKGKKESSKKGDGDKPKVVVGKTKTAGKTAGGMSDAQLKKVNNRLQMEKQYKDLTRQPPSKKAAVTKFFADIAVNVARTQITAVANDMASQQVGKLLADKNLGKNAIKLPGVKDPTKKFDLNFPAPNPKKKFL